MGNTALKRANANGHAGGLRRQVSQLTEHHDTLAGRRRGLVLANDLAQPRNREHSRSLLAQCLADFDADRVEHGLHLLLGEPLF